MPGSRFARSLLTYIAVGLLAAVGVLYFFPEKLQQPPQTDQAKAPPVVAPSTTPPRASGVFSYADAVDTAAPAVVNIFTSKRMVDRTPLFDDPILRRFFGNGEEPRQPREQTSLGSGVIVSEQGHILTNHHVIRGADAIEVLLLDGRRAEAEVIGNDPETDLAVLKVELAQVPVVPLGLAHELRVGDVVLAIGNPFGVGQTVTQGIVSATGRNRLGLSTFENFIQTDAAINPGNSGGALINARGELIGINTAIFSQSGGSVGIGFAIPVQLATGVMESIRQNGRVVRGWIGVEIQDLTQELAESFGLETPEGVLLAGVLNQGPAAKAGLQPGDVVREIDDASVNNAQMLLQLVASRAPGENITVEAMRDGKPVQVEVTIGERPSAEQLMQR